MRQICAVLLVMSCAASYAAEVRTSDEFIHLLRTNATEKRMGVSDPRQFVAKLDELASRGDPSAQFLMGLTVLKERRELAEGYFTPSAQAGCAGAEMGLGLLAMLKKQWALGVAHFKVAAARGDAMAQVTISGLHERGDHGMEKSLPKAYAWLRVAERQAFSNGGVLAIRDGMEQLRSKMTDEDAKQSEKDFTHIAASTPKANYYFCGQFNVDVSRDPAIPDDFRF